MRFKFGPRAGVLDRSLEHVRQVHRATGRKVSLVGWCLGGVLAREIAMGMNPVTWYTVADRPGQREGRWKPFHRKGWRRHLFNEPYRARGPG